MHGRTTIKINVLSLLTDILLISKVSVDRGFYINLYQNTAESINELYKLTLTLWLCPAVQVLDVKLQVYFALLLFVDKSPLLVSNIGPVVVIIVFVFDPINYRQ
jgi:hypothetical protein